MEQFKKSAINIRCYPWEKRAVDLLAHHEGVNISEFIRICIREAAKARGYENVLFSDLIETLPLTDVITANDQK